MLNSPTNSPTKDALERLNNLLNVVERRIHTLLDMNDLELMTPAQREQAASRYLMIYHDLLQLRQEYAISSADEDNPAIIRALIRGTDEIDEDECEYTPIQNGQ